MRRSVFIGLVLGASAAAVTIACRQDEPAGDPKTPANSPIPEPEPREPEPKPGPKLPSLRDAG
jgi:hypothetical protein